jgi:hypothetical protein|tara:strand:+ start:1430 stop:1612 length:183 start_codon:yes stop_codon:yes gene_type:complete
MIVYEISKDSYYRGNTKTIDGPGVKLGWTRTSPPTIPDGSYAKWMNTWVITTTPPPAYEE